jgi:lipopolysaccharide assembly protein A
VLARYVKIVLLSLITLVFVAFAVSNRDAVNLSFFPLPYSAEMPKFLLAILCFTLGAVVAALLLSLKLAKIQHRYNAEHKRAMALENEIKGLQAEQQSHLRAVSTRN